MEEKKEGCTGPRKPCRMLEKGIDRRDSKHEGKKIKRRDS